MKRILKVFLAVLLLGIIGAPPVTKAVTPVEVKTVHVFEREECAHCQDEKAFFEELKKTMAGLAVEYHNIKDDAEKQKFETIAKTLGLSQATPITVIGEEVVQGFDRAETTGKTLRYLIEEMFKKPAVDLDQALSGNQLKSYFVSNAACSEDGSTPCAAGNEYWINIPFYGPVEILQYSLPAMSLLLGFVDGFNPCAMWVLVMFLAILMEAGSRRRMFEMAGLFILAEAMMYYLILNVWMTTWDFVGLDRIITPIVGVVAVSAGSWFLYLFYKADTTCKVGNLESKKRAREKIKAYALAPMTIAVALGILGLALSVNIIEFACSIGIPQTFTKILDLNALSWLQKQGYNALYILMYMVDDLIVFAAALWSFDKIGLTTHKYTRASHFIGGLIMVILGLILLLKPSLLVF